MEYVYDAANHLTKVGTITYTWDYNGNLLDDGVRTYEYDDANRLVQVVSGTFTTTFTYNADGLRVAQRVDGEVTIFVWDWASGVPEMLSGGENLYLVGAETSSRWDGMAWAYYLPDALGSVRQVADGTGAVVSSREWTPSGGEVGAAQAGLGYAGEWWDADAGLLYLRARWYEPRTGRFTQRDPWEGDYYQPQTLLRNYLYVLNNPTNHTDPTGRTRNFSCNWPDTNLKMLLDGKVWSVDNQLCGALDDPGASLKLIQDFYRRLVIPALVFSGAPDAALLLERSLEEKTTPYEVTLRLGRQLMEIPEHINRLKTQEGIWLTDLMHQALSMPCDSSQPFEHKSPALSISAYNAGETVNVRFAMASHSAWFTWQGTIMRTCNGWDVWGMLGRDIADYSNWHGDPHDYNGDGILECPEGDCYKTASFDLASLPNFIKDSVLPPGQANTRITIPDDWMARLVIGGEASNPGFGIYFNTREWFGFNITGWSTLPIVKYGGLDWGNKYREPGHEIQPSYGPP